MATETRNSIFISYAHEDEAWRRYFQEMLETAPPLQKGLVRVWTDENIDPGADWRGTITSALEQTRVALLLVTNAFLQSEFIRKKELPELRRNAQNAEGMSIVWVPIDVTLEAARGLLSDLQAFGDLSKPLASMTQHEQGLEVKRICEHILSKMGLATQIDSKARIRLNEELREALWFMNFYEELSAGEQALLHRTTYRGGDAVLKVFVPDRFKSNSYSAFKRTKERARRLKHPAFVELLRADVVRDLPYVVTEHVPHSETLAGHLARNGPMPAVDVVSIILYLAEALQEFHEDFASEPRTYYGSIMPSDVLLETTRKPRIYAFPFGRFIEDYEKLQGTICVDKGRMSYMCPERYHGWPMTPLSDQYALGILAYEMLEGEFPYGRIRCPADYQKILEFYQQPVSAKTGNWQFSGLGRVILRLLAEDPGQRYASMAHLAADLRYLSHVNDYVALAKMSFSRDLLGNDRFFQRFYRKLFALAPDSERFFGSRGALEDGRMAARQVRMLEGAIKQLLNVTDISLVEEPTALSDIAASHAAMQLDSGARLSAYHFEAFRDAFLQTLEQDYGEWSENDSPPDPSEIEAWRKSIEPGINYLSARVTEN